MPKYDHFHVEYEVRAGVREELEGGWSGYPGQWDSWSKTRQWLWIDELARSWGMPAIGIVKRFWLAG